ARWVDWFNHRRLY
ncbi:hypothetical protein LDH32_13595, partial [Mycobacterium tuberculosis]